MKNACGKVRRLRDFKNGAFFIETPLSEREFIQTMRQADPVFVRHIMPVQKEVRITGKKEVDLPAILETVQELCALDTGDTFSVQCRRLGTYYDYRTRDAEVYVGQVLQAQGAQPVFTEPNVDRQRMIISVFLFLNKGYIGRSSVSDNLSGHCDINKLFYGEEPQVSRAEFKLREALHKFDVDIQQGRALDLGAAPGGWTNVLADGGAEVTAVDPGDLDESVRSRTTVYHVKSRVEDWVCDGKYDLIVNDMNVEPKDTVAAMQNVRDCLRPSGQAIVTVKLIRDRHPRKLLRRAIRDLEAEYEVAGVKHLFHNRREVTVHLKSSKK